MMGARSRTSVVWPMLLGPLLMLAPPGAAATEAKPSEEAATSEQQVRHEVEQEIAERREAMVDEAHVVPRSLWVLTRSEREIPSWSRPPQAAWLSSMPRFSARFPAGVVQPRTS